MGAEGMLRRMIIRTRRVSLIVLLLLFLVPAVGVAEDGMTVEGLYARLLENYGKIEDMRCVMIHSSNEPPSGVMEVSYTMTDNVYYKVPRMLMIEFYQNNG